MGTNATPDLSEFEALSKAHPARCKMARILDELSDEDRQKCQAALDAEHISHNAVVKWLRLAPRDHRIHDGAVKKHRIGDCCCERP